jgi:ATP-dependent RNA helicase RhlB
MELAYMFMNDAVKVEVKPEQVTAEGVTHHLYHVGVHEKMSALLGIINREGAERTLIFVNMRRTADRLCRTLEFNGLAAEQITGDIDQRKRLRILEDFREGRLPILVATDVASRGLHIEGVTHVINYDLPLDAEDYVHRVGRTARAGATGTAISLACEDYVENLEAIEGLIGFKIPHDFPDDALLLPVKHPPRAPRTHAAPGGRRGEPRRDRAGAGRGVRSGGGRSSEPRESHAEASPRDPHAADGAPTPSVPVDAEAPGAAPRRRRRRRKPGEASSAPREGATPAGAAPAANSSGELAAAGAPAKRRRRRRRSKSASAEAPGGEVPSAGAKG